MAVKKIAIFASGKGSNAKAIIDYFKNKEKIKISLILSNIPNSGVLNLADKHQIETLIFSKDELNTSSNVVDKLLALKIDLIVLAGFLLLIPTVLINKFPMKIINIHPALLPKYGGKGMYGIHVHRAVKKAAEVQSGITIHYVDKYYDKGKCIFQKTCDIKSTDTPEEIANKVLKLEHKYYPGVIENLLFS